MSEVVRVPVRVFREKRLTGAAWRAYVLGCAEGRTLRAAEVATLIGTSAVTARQVLQALESEGLVTRGFTEMPRTRQPAAVWTFRETEAA